MKKKFEPLAQDHIDHYKSKVSDPITYAPLHQYSSPNRHFIIKCESGEIIAEELRPESARLFCETADHLFEVLVKLEEAYARIDVLEGHLDDANMTQDPY